MSKPEEGLPRRIDVTLSRIEKLLLGLAPEHQEKLAGAGWLATIAIVGSVRSMERAEEMVRAAPADTLADTYDRIVQPGENACDAILRTSLAYWGQEKGIEGDAVV